MGISHLHYLLRTFLFICPQASELQSPSVYGSLAGTLWTCWGFNHLQHKGHGYDGVLNLIILSLFRSCTSDGFIYHLARLSLSLLKHSFRQLKSSMEEVNQSGEASRHLWFPCSTSLRLEIWGCHQCYSWKLACHGKSLLWGSDQGLAEGVGTYLTPFCVSVCLCLSFSSILVSFRDICNSNESVRSHNSQGSIHVMTVPPNQRCWNILIITQK